MLAHETNITLQLVRLHRVVFVEVEGNDVRERQALVAMHSYEVVVDTDRRAACRESECPLASVGRALANQFRVLIRDGAARLGGMRINALGYTFLLGLSVIRHGASGLPGRIISADIRCGGRVIEA